MAMSFDTSISKIDERITELKQELSSLMKAREVLVGLNGGEPTAEKPTSKRTRKQQTTKSTNGNGDLKPTDKQLYWLDRKGYEGDTDKLTRKEASDILDSLFHNDEEKKEAVEEEKSRPRRSKKAAEKSSGSVKRTTKVTRSRAPEPDDTDDEDETLAHAIRVLTEEDFTPKEIVEETGADINYVYRVRTEMRKTAK